MLQNECNLDQWITSAMAAMAFAAENWDAFTAYLGPVIHRDVPIDVYTMRHHALHLSKLQNVESMPL